MSNARTSGQRRRRQHGSGSITNVGTGKWRIGYDVRKATATQPRRQEFEVVKGDKKHAAEVLATRLEAARKGEYAEDSCLTFAELSDRFLTAKKLSKEPTTYALYERTLRQHVTPVIGHVRGRKLTVPQIQSLLDGATNKSRTQRSGERLSGTTLTNVRIIVHAVLGFGVRQGLLSRNVCDLVDPPVQHYVERPFLRIDDIPALFAAAQGTELEAVVPFAIGTGARRSEICAIQWGDIELETGRYSLKRAAKNIDGKVVIGALKTKRSARADVLPAFVSEVLARYRAEQERRHEALGKGEVRSDTFVFDRFDGRAWDPNEMSRIFCRLVRSRKLPPLRFHDLRHGFASLAFAAGIPMKAISDSLGHSSINVTANVYTHLMEEGRREKAERLDAYLADAVRPSSRLRLVS